MGARYYDPTTARFLTRDPIMGINDYTYAYNNPVKYFDTNGFSGSYIKDVGEVFKGYGDVLNPVSAVKGIVALPSAIKNNGLKETARAVGQGLVDTAVTIATTDDPREFGEAFGTALSVAGGTAAVGKGAATAVARNVGKTAALSASQFTKVAKSIAKGHAKTKHITEFKNIGVTTEVQLAKHVEKVMKNAKGQNIRVLDNQRTAYWDPVTKTVVIYNSKVADKGTVFKSSWRYFEKSLK